MSFKINCVQLNTVGLYENTETNTFYNIQTQDFKNIYNINKSDNDTSLKKDSITFLTEKCISNKNTKTSMINLSNTNQKCTFGDAINNKWIIGGNGINTLLTSSDGLNWSPLKDSINTPFLNNCNSISWNGQIWISTGDNDKMYYSENGSNWRETLVNFSEKLNITNNGYAWLLTGSSNNNDSCILYSTNGINWFTSTISPYELNSQICRCAKWNGEFWLAGLSNGIVIKSNFKNGKSWNIVSDKIVFNLGWNDICWNGNIWVGFGEGLNTISWSKDGTNWFSIGNSVFSISGKKVDWNGKFFIGVGSGINSIAYSTDGKIWTGLGTSIFSDIGNSICWNGNMWIAVGEGTNSIAISKTGKSWKGLGNNLITSGKTIYFNSTRPQITSFENLTFATGKTPNGLRFSTNNIDWRDTFTYNPIDDIVYSIDYNGEIFLEGGKGEFHTIAYSYDYISWTGIGKNIFSISTRCFKWNGEFWIAGGEGTNSLAYSLDGKNWIAIQNSSDIFSECRSIDWNGAIWIAGGLGKNKIAWSKNGLEWFGLGNVNFEGVVCVYWTGNMWLCGGVGVSGNGLAKSLDGLSWTNISIGNQYNSIISISSNKNIILCGVSVLKSHGYVPIICSFNKGETFVINNVFKYNTNDHCVSLCWTGEKWLMISRNGHCYTSIDGINWQKISNIFNFGTSIKVFKNINIISIQMPILAFGSGQNTIAYSKNGINWFGLYNNIFSISGNGAFWNGNFFVSGGKGKENTIAWSKNGLEWIGLGKNIFSEICYGVFWDNKKWIGYGSGNNTIAWSKNGLEWIGLGKNIFSETCKKISSHNLLTFPKYIATGSGLNTIAYSQDGLTWSSVINSPLTIRGNSVIWASNGYYGNKWIAVGEGTQHTMCYSLDGINWIGLGNLLFSIRGNDVCWNGKIFIAVGEGINSICYSANGISWFGVDFSLNIFTSGNSVTWNGTSFIAVGTGNFQFAVSTDGVSWKGLNFLENLFDVPNSIYTNDQNTSGINSCFYLSKEKTIDIVSDSYYNTGTGNIIFSIE